MRKYTEEQTPKENYLGHCSTENDILRTRDPKERTEKFCFTRYIEGRRRHGKQRETFLNYFEKMTDRTPMEPFRLTMDREIWVELCK